MSARLADEQQARQKLSEEMIIIRVQHKEEVRAFQELLVQHGRATSSARQESAALVEAECQSNNATAACIAPTDAERCSQPGQHHLASAARGQRSTEEGNHVADMKSFSERANDRTNFFHR